MNYYRTPNGVVSTIGTLDYEEITEEEFNRLMPVYEETEPEEEPQTTFTREEFNLLEVQKDGVIYTIYEEDGTVTYVKGDNR